MYKDKGQEKCQGYFFRMNLTGVSTVMGFGHAPTF